MRDVMYNMMTVVNTTLWYIRKLLRESILKVPITRIIFFSFIVSTWDDCCLVARVQIFVTPWTAAGQTSLFFIISQSSLIFMSTESVMPSHHLILCHPLVLLPSIFLSIRVFSNELALFESDGQSIRASALASVFPMNTQGWFPLGLMGSVSLLSMGLKQSSPTPQFENLNSLALSLPYSQTLTSIHDYWKNHSFD